MYAVRNIQLCTKDCLCLYVCPTGATDTETGQIDPDKCLSGCRACVDACPSHAISLVPKVYPPQQEKNPAVVGLLKDLAEGKLEQSSIAQNIVTTAEDPVTKQLAKALSLSSQLMAEDLLREAGYLLPQSLSVQKLLNTLLDTTKEEDFPKDEVHKLLLLLKANNTDVSDLEKTQNIKFRCGACGYIHEGDLPDDFICPICQQPASIFVEI